ncbi:Inositol polyphosphate kinase domain-containing protein [Rozella allomycis CSF55]|uniref:Kinase n=1 Tax=Rozella allomycis (strain CSF55) TaxID=988480 RepID=A0A075B1L6_ROZAC|nr:Inositol polyphosphate kinase domain-containing protein [Rozella allomycis CSF55]|eukprot:EPZ34678.1 Inositol polyphosphate kinase domain-containing protein [Rozella allomycis CSF55]
MNINTKSDSSDNSKVSDVSSSSCSTPEPPFDLSNSPSSVPLIPFTNQVGGHASFLRFTEKALCKPMTLREKEFYESIERFNPTLKEFTPIYLGVINVSYPSNGNIEKRFNKTPSTPEVILEKNKHIFEGFKKSVNHRRSKSSDSKIPNSPSERKKNSRSNRFHNPWSLKMYKNMCYKFSGEESNSTVSIGNDTHQFILLQDLTDGLRYPCVLDLKMGDRQYGVGCSLKKKESQIRKVQGTTSAALGVRVCGMQITSGSYFFQNKYDGRKLTVEQFKQTLVKFLHNGRVVLKNFIPYIIHKLKKLKSVISEAHQYRLFSSSLLLIYDGFWPEDFEFCGDENNSEKKDQDDSLPGCSYPSTPNTLKLKDKIPLETYTKRKIDIKIIDFTNCVSPLNFDDSLALDSEITVGTPDDGYIKGLDSLILFFNEILNE